MSEKNKIMTQSLPEQFNALHYKILNLDLYKLSHDELVEHYITDGQPEGRGCSIPGFKLSPSTIKTLTDSLIFNKYRDELPSDFNVEHYKNLHDLDRMDVFGVIQHYLKYKLPHAYPPEVSVDFDVELYLKAHPDLRTAFTKSSEVLRHYAKNGVRENRTYLLSNKTLRDGFEYPEIVGNCCILINHRSELTGGSTYLYELAVHLTENKIFDNVLVFDVYRNSEVESVYYHLFEREPVYYYHDIGLLHEYIRYYNPVFVYSNSLNISLYEIEKFRDVLPKFVFHFHETMEHLVSTLGEEHMKMLTDIIRENIIYVVSEKIRNDFMNRYDCLDVRVATPYLSSRKREFMDQAVTQHPKQNTGHELVFGMCGTRCERKGYDLFIDVARRMPQHKFIWIGGDIDSDLDELDNFIQVKQTTDPYGYFNEMDYLLVTSKEDPCPYIILEALYMKIPCIVLEGNVMYKHELSSFYYEIPNHDNNADNIVKYLETTDFLRKKNTLVGVSDMKDYVMSKFSKPLMLCKR